MLGRDPNNNPLNDLSLGLNLGYLTPKDNTSIADLSRVITKHNSPSMQPQSYQQQTQNSNHIHSHSQSHSHSNHNHSSILPPKLHTLKKRLSFSKNHKNKITTNNSNDMNGDMNHKFNKNNKNNKNMNSNNNTQIQQNKTNVLIKSPPPPKIIAISLKGGMKFTSPIPNNNTSQTANTFTQQTLQQLPPSLTITSQTPSVNGDDNDDNDDNMSDNEMENNIRQIKEKDGRGSGGGGGGGGARLSLTPRVQTVGNMKHSTAPILGSKTYGNHSRNHSRNESINSLGTQDGSNAGGHISNTLLMDLENVFPEFLFPLTRDTFDMIQKHWTELENEISPYASMYFEKGLYLKITHIKNTRDEIKVFYALENRMGIMVGVGLGF